MVKCAGLLVLMVGVAGVAHADVTRSYTVRQHETCLEIAVRELGSAGALADLHRINPQLGPLPHHLQAGQRITLPGAQASAPDALLSAQRGAVEVRRAGDDGWLPRATGTGLFRAWRVGARAQATAQVTFRDTSQVAMRENTVIVIFGPTGKTAVVGSYAATLETGALRTRLAELGGGGALRVSTPSGQVALQGGSAIVAADAEETRVSNHAGAPAELRGRTRRVRVAPGYGATVARRRDPTPPRPLPPVPAWTSTDALLAIGWPGQGGELRASWAPAPEARRFHIELAHDRALGHVEVALDVDASVTSFVAQHLPPGDYFLVVSAIDAHGLESPPSAPRAVHVAELPLPSTASTEAANVEVGLGSALEVPAGMRCALDGAAPATRIDLDTAGDQALRCEGAEALLRLHVVPVLVRASGPPPRVVLGATAELPLLVTAAIAPVVPLSAVGDPGLEATLIAPAPGVLRVHATTPGVHTVRIVSGAIEVARIEVIVTAPAVAELAPHVAPGQAPELAPGAPSTPRSRGAAALELGTFAGIDASRADIGPTAGLTAAARIAAGVQAEIGVARQLATDGDTTVQAGIAVGPVAGIARPRLRLGFAASHLSLQGVGGYVGGDLVTQVGAHAAVVLGVDGIALPTDYAVVGSLGVRLRW